MFLRACKFVVNFTRSYASNSPVKYGFFRCPKCHVAYTHSTEMRGSTHQHRTCNVHMITTRSPGITLTRRVSLRYHWDDLFRRRGYI